MFSPVFISDQGDAVAEGETKIAEGEGEAKAEEAEKASGKGEAEATLSVSTAKYECLHSWAVWWKRAKSRGSWWFSDWDRWKRFRRWWPIRWATRWLWLYRAIRGKDPHRNGECARGRIPWRASSSWFFCGSF
nr:hypothetical protein [Crucivirus sp.]